MEKLFCTDLDSTIICSQEPEDFGVCVAMKDGRKSSFMNNDSYIKFVEIVKKIKVLPITTRCERSYNNIHLKIFFNYALVDNGAILVCDNKKEKEDWLEESRIIVKDDKENFEKIRKIIEKYGYKEKWGSEFVLDYVNKDITSKAKEKLLEEIKPYTSNLLVNIGETSFVCTFDKLSKGNNIKRFAQKYNYELYISSGDNKEDESMFKVTTISIGKKNALYNYETKDKLTFCDKVINKVYEIIN